MASIYLRGRKWWFRVKVGGVWQSKPTPFLEADKAKAERYADAAQKALDARKPDAPTGPLTVRAYSVRWLATREQAGLDWRKDRGMLANHVLPAIGDRMLADVRAPQIAEVIRVVRHERKLAARTVHNVYTVVAAMFRDAAIDGSIEQTPCILTKRQLGPIVDKDPEWRAQAVFSRDEAEILISHPGIPADRRLVYGFGLLAGMRPGEVGALRWRHYDAAAEPLGRLTVALSYSSSRNLTKGTKTLAVRSVPVHPTLAAMLAEWKLAGWAAMMGRAPEPDDLIVPLPPEHAARRKRTDDPRRGDTYTYRRWIDEDEPLLGWRHREVYATKSTFITLAIDDGADRDVLELRVTHSKPRRSAFDGYDRGPHWRETCAEVAKLQIQRRATVLATVSSISPDSDDLHGSGGGFRRLNPDTSSRDKERKLP